MTISIMTFMSPNFMNQRTFTWTQGQPTHGWFCQRMGNKCGMETLNKLWWTYRSVLTWHRVF